MTQPMRLGIIGVGQISRAHFRAAAQLEGVAIVAAADINEAALQRARDAHDIPRTYLNNDDLFADDELDAVIICTPPAFHAELAVDAATAGLHVHCEKPLAVTAAEASAMVDAAAKNGVVLSVCSGRLSADPETAFAADYVASGALGQLYQGRLTRLRTRGRPVYDAGYGNDWFLNRDVAGGGALLDIGCYGLDRFLAIAGDPTPERVSGLTFKGIESPQAYAADRVASGELRYDVEEHAAGVVHFAEGWSLLLEAAWATQTDKSDELELMGSKGGLRIASKGDEGSHLRLYQEVQGSFSEVTPRIRMPRDYSGEATQLAAFAAACRDHGAPVTPGTRGLLATQISEALYRSASEGREISVAELT